MKHCLLVDDSSVVRKVARSILEQMDFTVTEADNGRAALEQCRARMPDAVLLDWQMPVMDGIDFLAALRKQEGGHRPKVIFVTTENDVDQITRAIAAGANAYVLKPFDRDLLLEKLRQVDLA